jgi:hypothetical protein
MEPKSRVELWLSEDELRLLERLAEREGLSREDYLRLLIRQHAARPAQLAQAFRHGAGLGDRVDLANAFDSDGTKLDKRR